MRRHMLLAAGLYLSVLYLACTVANPEYRPPRPDGEPQLDGLAPDAGVPVLPEPDASGTPVASLDVWSRAANNPGCDLRVFYRDLDADGRGDSTQVIEACQQPVGYAQVGGDCDDLDPEVYPGQEAFFALESVGTRTHDYNCDGVVEQELPALVACQQGAAGCVGDGWAWAVPGCGEGGMLAYCVPYLALGCGPWSIWSVQRCR